MSNARQASYNPTLTTYAQGVAQDISSAVANLIAPIVSVQSSIGAFKSFDKQNMFQTPDTARAMGGAANRVQMLATDPTYNCKPQALEITIDDAEMDAAGPQSQALIESKIKTLVASAVNSHELKVVQKAAASVSATGSKGTWYSTETHSPVPDIDGEIKDIVTACGVMPNTIIFGLGAWYRFRASSKTRAYFPGSTAVAIGTQNASGLFLNPGMNVVVAPMIYDTKKLGGTQSLSGIVGDDVWIFYSSPSPTAYDASFMKTFQGGRGGVQAVRSYRDESSRCMVYALDWTEDIQVVTSTACKRLTTS
jgi:hypothetical protein